MEQVPALPDDVLDLGRRLIPAPVFLVGCARSGTSIFGEALAAHPDVSYLFELSPLWSRVVEEGDDHRLTASAVDERVAREIYEGLAEAVGDEPRLVLLEKNPKHVLRLPFLSALFPWARFLHIVRDGRDVTASLMFRNRGQSWGHLQVPGWRELLARYPEANHIRCAHQWRIAVEIARADAAALGDRYLEVRYEALVADPASVVEPALVHCGLGVTDEVRAFWTRIQDETAGSYHARKQVRHYVENHSRRVGRHVENLAPEALREVERVCGDLLVALGYQV